MSNRYEASGSTGSAVAANGAYMEIRNTSARRILVEEIGFFLGAATASRIALVRATAQGVGGTAMVGLAEDPNAPAAAGSVVAATFTTAPTASATAYLRRASLAASVGAGLIWTWPQSDRLIVPPSGSLLVVGIAAGSASADFYAVWTE